MSSEAAKRAEGPRKWSNRFREISRRFITLRARFAEAFTRL
jgi:hypothetical protein